MLHQLPQQVADTVNFGTQFSREIRGLPVVFDGCGGGHECMVVASKRAVMLARLPLIQISPNQHDSKRQTTAGERFKAR